MSYATCILDGEGREREYHLAIPVGFSSENINPSVFELIGVGIVARVDREYQLGLTKLVFYKLRPGRPRWAR